jgi:hypothetical protein
MGSVHSSEAERPLVIVVKPITLGRFQAVLAGNDELLAASSRQPFVDSARVLAAKGNDGNTLLIMKHLGSDSAALKARLSIAARSTVEEGPNGPRFVPFRTGPKPRVAALPIVSGVQAAAEAPEVTSKASTQRTGNRGSPAVVTGHRSNGGC